MFVKISAAKVRGSYPSSVQAYIAYLEKENLGKQPEEQEFFFSQDQDRVSPDLVTEDIDQNTFKIGRNYPKFYAITISPSADELRFIQNSPAALKQYTRELMKVYPAAFHREIDGRPVNVHDIKYYAKIEYERSYKRTDLAVRENFPFLKKIRALDKEIAQIRNGKKSGNLDNLSRRRSSTIEQIPHKIEGQIIKPGLKKQGLQSHIHIVMSRRDASNRYSLSPGSNYRACEIKLHGKIIKAGFCRDHFYSSAEKTFDKLFNYKRNYVESYDGRKTFLKDPGSYYARLEGLAPAEKSTAFRMLSSKKSGVEMSPRQISSALGCFRKAIEKGIRASSIEY